ncbi:hypothetical protein Tco_1118379 [Tanacetum coccineum]
MGTPTQVCVWSCPNFSAPAGMPFRCVSDIWLWISGEAKVCQIKRMSTLVFVDPESSTQADGAQSSRVPVPLPEDPYEAIRTARMVVRVPPAMSSGLFASMAEVAAMSESVFRTSELVEDSEEDDNEEDEEIEDSMDSDNVSEDVEDEGPTAEDEDPAAGVEGLTAGVEGPCMDDESYCLDCESHGMDDESQGLDDEGHGVESDGLGLGYRALRRRELALEEDQVYSTFEVGQGSGSAPESERPERVSTSRQLTLTTWTDSEDGMVYIDVSAYPQPAPLVQTPPSPEWTSGSLPISLSPSVVPSPISSPMIPLTVPSPVATPATIETEEFLTELGAQVEMHEGLIRDQAIRLEELSPALFERSLEYEQERVAGKNSDLRLQLAEERCARLELVEVVDGIRRGQEPRGGA